MEDRPVFLEKIRNFDISRRHLVHQRMGHPQVSENQKWMWTGVGDFVGCPICRLNREIRFLEDKGFRVIFYEDRPIHKMEDRLFKKLKYGVLSESEYADEIKKLWESYLNVGLN